MSDEEIRALERQVATGSVSARLELSRALERLGRRDEALDALLPARESAEVRREIARFPTWSSLGGGPGRTNWVDVAPVVRKPHVLWKANAREVIAASTLGVVVRSEMSVDILDPDSGSIRNRRHHRDPFPGVPLLVEGVSLSPKDGGIVAEDVFKGGIVYETEANDLLGATLFPRSRGLLALGQRFIAWIEHRDPWKAPGPVVWRRDITHESRMDGKVGTERVGFARGLTLSVNAFELATGEVLGEHSGELLFADECGVVERRGASNGFRWGLHALDGTPIWQRDPSHGWPVALLPGHVAVSRETSGVGVYDFVVLLLDRATGLITSKFSWMYPPPSIAFARDVSYVGSLKGHLGAFSLVGEELWRMKLGLNVPVNQLAPFSRRLLAVADGEVFCFAAD